MTNNRIREQHTTKQGYVATIVNYENSQSCSVKFNDVKETIIHSVRYYWLVRGAVNNPNHKTIHGVGFLGQGKYISSIKGSDTAEYVVWSKMIARCYSSVQQDKQPSYKGCSVHHDWHNFQNFAEWFSNNYVKGYHLDKDILVKGNKVYGPETCCFVPIEINSLFTKNNINRGKYPVGVSENGNKFLAKINIGKIRKNLGRYSTPQSAFIAYKNAKESHIKDVADQWKCKICAAVHSALYNYQVEITD